MTGTALTEAKILGYLQNECRRDSYQSRVATQRAYDVIYLEEKHKFKVMADEVEALNKYDTIEYYNGDLYSGTIESERKLCCPPSVRQS